MLAYNKLNRLSLNLTGHRAQEVVADAPAIETELKKREGDNDSFAQLKYIQMMAYMMLGQWNENNRISQLMNQMPPQRCCCRTCPCAIGPGCAMYTH